MTVDWWVDKMHLEDNHAVVRVVGLYSTCSLRYVRDVRMDWYWIGLELVRDLGIVTRIGVGLTCPVSI